MNSSKTLNVIVPEWLPDDVDRDRRRCSLYTREQIDDSFRPETPLGTSEMSKI